MRRQLVAAAAALVALILVLAACGSGDDRADQTSPAGAPAGPQRADFQQFARCMADNGVTLPSGPPQAGQRPDFDPSDPTFQAALQACSEYAPAPPGGAAPPSGVAPPNGASPPDAQSGADAGSV